MAVTTARATCRSYLNTDPTATHFRVMGFPITVQRNKNGVPWYIFLLLLYCLYRLVRKLLLRLLKWTGGGRVSGRPRPSSVRGPANEQ